ncbi:thiopurine S-methyltransferase [Pleionea sp. CnH1-48]|uniref:thiopurine S-methyltransferase n=1 Tax=Pleionea sp. CnH1-48 TaxID=2954494 RepID=UPI002096EAC0|nr:thiopurine S-methyltransferase [Pleionea sp. CnH1-48]MCO7222710.1 thiopurine S-methyltransferase [Pleionea sp. CnH1-48]
MKAEFWHDKWQSGDIAFHESDGNPLLKEHFHLLNLGKGNRVFLPLCGKTGDIAWFMSQGLQVVGVELSRLAIEELFAELQVTPEITYEGELIRFSSPGVDIFVGDIFHLDAENLGHVDAIYDRAALIALPEDIRRRYASHLIALSSTAPQLLITYEYDKDLLQGPPFSLEQPDLLVHYGSSYQLHSVFRLKEENGLKDNVDCVSSVWHLEPKESSA